MPTAAKVAAFSALWAVLWAFWGAVAAATAGHLSAPRLPLPLPPLLAQAGPAPDLGLRELVTSLVNAGGMGTLAGVLFYLHVRSLNVFREELATERRVSLEQHEKVMERLDDLKDRLPPQSRVGL